MTQAADRFPGEGDKHFTHDNTDPATMKIANRVQLTILVMALLGASAVACQVPVFRYALERWSADKYEVWIVHSGPLDASSQALVDKLESLKLGENANLEIQIIALSNLREKRLVELWKNRLALDKPLMVVLYPHSAREVPDRVLVAQSLTEQHFDQLVHSHVREQLAQRLSSGQTAVWIYVPCGDEAQDAAALKLLNARIAVNRARLTVPTADELEIAPAILATNKIPLRIEFTILTLERTDPSESFLLKSLDKSESDLGATQPLAFPVFGRGRVLYALVGAGIAEKNIDTACQFVAGPCSCQVKNQNPGFDLLISSKWDEAVAGSIISAAIPEETAEPRLLTIPPGRTNK